MQAEFLASFIIEGHGVISQNGASLPVETGDIIFRTTALPSEVRMLTDSRLVVIKGSLLNLLGMHLQRYFAVHRPTRGCRRCRWCARRTSCLGHVFFRAEPTRSSPTSSMFAEQALICRLLAAIYTSQALEQTAHHRSAVPIESWQAITSYRGFTHIVDSELVRRGGGPRVAGVQPLGASLVPDAAAFNTASTCANAGWNWPALALVDPCKAHVAVKDIALSCGFQDASHFSRCFQQALRQPAQSNIARNGSGPQD